MIVAIIRKEYEIATTAYRLLHAEHIGIVASANAWDEHNPDDGVGGMSQNPYNIQIASSKDIASRIRVEKVREAYNFAIDTFLDNEIMKR